MTDNMQVRVETEVKDAYQFIFGGNAEFTIENTQTKKGCKYKVTRCKDKKDLFFVKTKDEGSWNYAGYMKVLEDGRISYKVGNKGSKSYESSEIQGLAYAIRKGHNPLPYPMIMMHHGKCACCGKKLDDAVSVARGIGPVCWDRLTEGSKNKLMEKKASTPEMPFE